METPCAAVDGQPWRLCVFFDLESTGLDIEFAEVVEVGSVARVLQPGGGWSELIEPGFRALLKPSRRLPRRVARLTGLQAGQLEREGVSFRLALAAWRAWILRQAAATALLADQVGVEVWLVGHNVLGYDLPLLVAQDLRARRADARGGPGYHHACGLFEGIGNLVGVVDTLRLSRLLARRGELCTASHRLGALHELLVGRQLSQAHTALGDAAGLAELCAAPPMQGSLAEAFAGLRGAADPARSAPPAVAMPASLAEARVLASRATRRAQQKRDQSRTSRKRDLYFCDVSAYTLAGTDAPTTSKAAKAEPSTAEMVVQIPTVIVDRGPVLVQPCSPAAVARKACRISLGVAWRATTNRRASLRGGQRLGRRQGEGEGEREGGARGTASAVAVAASPRPRRPRWRRGVLKVRGVVAKLAGS